MPLSKARDRERKRLFRLESGKVQPKRLYPVQPKDLKARLKEQGIAIDGNRVARQQPTIQPTMVYPIFTREEIISAMNSVASPELDADGNPIPEL